VRSMFSCVRASYDLCARAHAHSLEGTLIASEELEEENLEKCRNTVNKQICVMFVCHLYLCATVHGHFYTCLFVIQ